MRMSNHRKLMDQCFFFLFFITLQIISIQARIAGTTINRYNVINRHNIHFTSLNKKSVLSLAVGNGVICFNADITGFQTLNDTYEHSGFPLTTLTDWAWHSIPFNPQATSPFYGFKYTEYHTTAHPEHPVPYPMSGQSAKGIDTWLRANPHRLDIIQIALRTQSKSSSPINSDDITDINQSLILWNSSLMSSFKYKEQSVQVITLCHPELDLLSWQVISPLLARDKEHGLLLRLAFPYGSTCFTCAGHDWHTGLNHTIHIERNTTTSFQLRHNLDYDSYLISCKWSSSAWVLDADGPHAFVLRPIKDLMDEKEDIKLEISCLFSPFNVTYPIGNNELWLSKKAETTRLLLMNNSIPSFTEVASATNIGWSRFWNSGAAVDVASNTNDPRAFELERRIVLSQFLTRQQSTGAMPPQETGLTLNSWYGKHHKEMRYWHQAHFALWGRSTFLSRSDAWYLEALANATSFASFQGYRGARWPKMTGPCTSPQDSPVRTPSIGHNLSNISSPLLYWDSPSSVGPLLVWEQPHVIWMAELQRLMADNDTDRAKIVSRLSEIVFATAEFMASYPSPPLPDQKSFDDELWLGPPIIGGEENGNDALGVWNPTFELTYWRLGLKIANEWKVYKGLKPNPKWVNISQFLSLPSIVKVNKTSVYNINGNCKGFPTGKLKHCGAYVSHPLFVGALGMINGAAINPPIDEKIMNSTIAYVLNGWEWNTAWGWDFPLLAMTLQRLSFTPDFIVDLLLKNTTKNTYVQNGHNCGMGCPGVYLPGNGGILTSVAMMAGGFTDGNNKVRNKNWFPLEWKVMSEGFKPYP